MSNRRKAHLDALEARLTGPKRIALFGHRAVGKTTLLAMFYREASAGRVSGVRLASARPSTAEYLAEKIAQIESGEPLAGTLAETELHLRLYHDAARFDLIVKDYQGEHVALGSEAPIREFFADCDAVFLCLDPEGSEEPTERTRRQQEVESLLERYIESTDDATAGRPVAILITKYDHVLAQGGPPPDQVEHLADALYGMTRHALAQHVLRSAVFAVSAYGLGAVGDRPPVELHPLGLDGPLVWLAEQLEDIDREQLEWLWDLAPEDLARLTRCVKAYERRYPKSDHVIGFRRRLNALRRRRLRKGLVRAAVAAGLVVAALAGYDALGFRDALAFERQGYPPTAVERRWRDFLAWHPLQPVFFPDQARDARDKLREWTVKAAEQRVAVGTETPDLPETLTQLKEQAPDRIEDIRRVEDAIRQKRHDERWRELRTADLVEDDRPEERVAAYQAFLREFPESPNCEEALKRIAESKQLLAERRDRSERSEVDALARELALPDADLTGLIEQARTFLGERPESRYIAEVEDLMDAATRRIDEADIQEARDFARKFPTNFATRRRKYEEYLADHRDGGQFVREALDALEQIDTERDLYAYRRAFDYWLAHTQDVPEIAKLLRTYLNENPAGRYVDAANTYLAWWDQISEPHNYRVTLKRGKVGEDVGKYLSGGGPDLGVVVFVNGVQYGPTPAVPNSRNPNWNYTFPRDITWKYGWPISVRVLDFDWSSSGTGVFRFNTPDGDPLAMRFLSQEIAPSRGGRTRLVFESDFHMPRLPRPESLSMAEGGNLRKQ